jgi:hypothetical protein
VTLAAVFVAVCPIAPAGVVSGMETVTATASAMKAEFMEAPISLIRPTNVTVLHALTRGEPNAYNGFQERRRSGIRGPCTSTDERAGAGVLDVVARYFAYDRVAAAVSDPQRLRA